MIFDTHREQAERDLDSVEKQTATGRGAHGEGPARRQGGKRGRDKEAGREADGEGGDEPGPGGIGPNVADPAEAITGGVMSQLPVVGAGSQPNGPDGGDPGEHDLMATQPVMCLGRRQSDAHWPADQLSSVKGGRKW